MLTPQEENSLLFGSDNGATAVENMTRTKEQTLVSVSGPAPLILSNGNDGPEASLDAAKTYGLGFGVFNKRKVLARHNGTSLQVFKGNNGGTWETVAAAADILEFKAELNDEDRPQSPTQFLATPTGFIIVPRGGGQPLFYDGEFLGQLGYSVGPGSPTLRARDEVSHQSKAMAKRARVGTFVQTANTGTAWLGVKLKGGWNGCTQWEDRWFNLSPPSVRTGTLEVEGRSTRAATATVPGVPPGYAGASDDADSDALIQIGWRDIDLGPKNTIARILGRSHDLFSSGSTQLFEVPQHDRPSEYNVGTLPDNIVYVFTDNNPDSQLILPIRDVAPVPQVTCAALGMGRAWIGTRDGAVMFSMEGRWGTFLKSDVIWPDAQKVDITGIHPVAGGMLVFSRHSTFFITNNDSGTGFRSYPVSTMIGCIAPSSLGTTRDGTTLWYGDGGFYTYKNNSVEFASKENEFRMSTLDFSKGVSAVAIVHDGEYRCWVTDNGYNDTCFVRDSDGWRRRFDTSARAATIIDDHRNYIYAAGTSSLGEAVYCLDHENQHTHATFSPREARLETAWMGALGSSRKSVYRVTVWLREYETGGVTLEVYKDWRSDLHNTYELSSQQPADLGLRLGTAELGEGRRWGNRRPMVVKQDIYLSNVETFKLALVGTGRWELVGFKVYIQDHNDKGHREPN